MTESGWREVLVDIDPQNRYYFIILFILIILY